MPKLSLDLPLPEDRKLTQAEFRRVEAFLDEWKEDVKRAAKRHPRKSYDLGVEQVNAFLRMLTRMSTITPPGTYGAGPTVREGIGWLETYTLHELDGALERYIDEVKSALLYGMRGVMNPTQMASAMYHATQDAQVNWRMVARTEAIRANAEGRLAACVQQGYDQVWAPPHMGACRKCKRILENKPFRIEDVRGVSNFGKPQSAWVACIPLHPNCRHAWVPYIPEVFEETMRQVALQEEMGLTEERLDEMFDDSGQLKPEYQDAVDWSAFKTLDPYEHALATAIEKVNGGRSAISVVKQLGADVTKGYFDNGQSELDPLLWTSNDQLRPEVREKVQSWALRALGSDSPSWARLYLTGGATSRQWAGRTPEADPDLDVQLVIDYDALRAARPSWRTLTAPEMHAALVTTVKATLAGVEAAPGVSLDGFIRAEATVDSFVADMRLTGQALYDVDHDGWIIPPADAVTAEDYGTPIMEGIGGAVALQHPEWVDEAQQVIWHLGSMLAGYDAAQDSDTAAQSLDALRQAYTLLHDARKASFEPGGGGERGRGNFVWQYVWNYGPLQRLKRLVHPEDAEKVWPDLAIDVAKADAPGGANYSPGVEHWITIHPHGEDEKGIPVLVRNNNDGTMSVIGGAGGHLNYLRLDGKKRIPDKKVGAADEKAAGKGLESLPEHQVGPENVPEAARDPEAIAREDAEAQARIQQHREHLQVVQEKQRAIRLQLASYVADLYGEAAGATEGALGWDELSGKQQKQALKAVKFSALHAAAFGAVDQADMNASPLAVKRDQPEEDPDGNTLDRKVADEHRDELESHPDATEPTEAEPRGKAAKIVALTTEQADQVNRLVAELGLLGKQASKSRQVIGGDTKISDAMALDYSEADVDAAVVSRVAAEKRTQVARAIYETMDSRGSKKLTERAMHQGGYDTVDTFAQAILGQSAIDPAVGKLLGVGGMAQLIASKLHEEARKGTVSLDAAYEALDELTKDREVFVAGRARTRALRAAEEAQQAREARKVSGQTTDPEGLYTETLSRSIETRKLIEAASSLGMAVAGLEAASALKVAMREQASGAASHIRIGGFPSPSHIRMLGEKVGVAIGDGDITREGNANYTLKLPTDRVQHLFAPPKPTDEALRDRLEQIRTGKDLDDEIESQRSTPGMTDLLSPAQAKGKMFLRAAGKGALLGFAPGVGKTHTAIAAAMDAMHAGAAEGKQHRALVVAPSAVLREWRDTVARQGGTYSAQVLGAQFDEGPDGPSSDAMRSKNWQKQLDEPADFNIVSYELLAKNPEIAEKLGSTIRICDEIQKAKNDSSLNFKALDSTTDQFDHAWNLTGTAIEKNTGDLHSALQTSAGGMESRSAFREKWDKVAQYEHVTAEDRIRQFREGISDKAFFLDANDAGNDLPPKNEGNEDGQMHEVKVDLSGAHKELLRQKVNEVNELQADRKRRREAGELDSKGRPIGSLPFGGRGIIQNALLKPGGLDRKEHAIVQAAADLCEQHPGDTYDGSKTDGQFAGDYAGKTVVFAEEVGHLKLLRDELVARGMTVFEGHSSQKMDGSGGMSNAENSSQIQAFLAHPDKCVFLSSDKNNAGINLQLGTAKGKFQHGATRLVHLTRPINNARLQQREARIHRRGSVAPVNTYHVTADTPYERSDADKLAQERRTQDLAGNAEDKVRTTSGEKVETVRHRYQRRGGEVPEHKMKEE